MNKMVEETVKNMMQPGERTREGLHRRRRAPVLWTMP